MLLGELLMTDHVDGIQLVAVVASAVGAVALLAGFFVRGLLRHIVVLLLLVLTLSGVLGAWEHFEEGEREASVPTTLAAVDPAGYQVIADRTSTTERAPQQENEQNEGGAEREGGGGSPPPLAPLSLSGLALMGAIVLLAKQDD
jgi:hypothetical protein